MPTTLERTVTIDRSLARRADRKLRRYGHSFNDAVNIVLNIIVAKRGDPFDESELEIPGPRLLASFREAEMMEKGLIPRQDFNSVEELFAECRCSFNRAFQRPSAVWQFYRQAGVPCDEHHRQLGACLS